MVEPADLEVLLAEQSGELKSIAEALVEGKRDKVVDGIAGLVLTVAAGNPLVAALAPFVRPLVAKAFGRAADEMLRLELANLQHEEARRAFLAKLDTILATAVGQAIVQMARVHHQSKEELVRALGGLRDDFDAFRRLFQAHLGQREFDAIVKLQFVEEGAVGVWLRPDTTRRVEIQEQHVRGSGSKGIVA